MFTTDDITKSLTKFDEDISSKYRPRDPSDSPKAYRSLAVVKKLSTGKFPIYLASSKLNKQNYAMKVFSHHGSDSLIFFKNEIRFASLKHPNIVDMVYYESGREAIYKGETKKTSYILMEYAPYGDLFNFIINYKDQIDEKLARTYFRQLIEGIEYLHANGIAHLDLKPENLLLGADFKLKIADFDLSHVYGDAKILSRGTPNYRAPEFFKSDNSSFSATVEFEQTFAADIYSAAVVLFLLKSGGVYPHLENGLFEGVNFGELLYKNNLKFWNKHYELQGKERSFYSRDFKELFNNMVRQNPEERLTLREIKQSRWYNGPVYTPEELVKKMKGILCC